MNLDALNIGIPDQKPWLNIVCNSLTANHINVPVASVSLFSANLSGPAVGLAPLGSTSTVCNNILVGSPVAFNLATNEYTCQENGALNVALYLHASSIALTSYTLELRKNGAIVDKPSSLRVNADSTSLTLTYLIRVVVGDVIGYLLRNDQAPNALTIDAIRFNGSYAK